MAKNLNSAVESLLKTASKSKSHLSMATDSGIQELTKSEGPMTLEKSIMRTLNGQGEVERLAFESDPTSANRHYGIFKHKWRLFPDKILKRIAIQDDLVAAIVQARQNHLSAFARPRPDRFSTGFIIEPRQEIMEAIERLDDKKKQAKKDELQKRISVVSKRLMTCGGDSLDIGGSQDRLTLPQYMSMSVRNAIVLGRIATEVLHNANGEFAGFRVIDAGTIYRAEPQQEATRALRQQAQRMLAEMRNERLKIDPVRFENDEYTWIQVIDDRPVQAFTNRECIVHNFYAVPDYELDGYPVTPLDTVIAAVTTHINITTMNKLFFQNGRAARGMLVIKSDDVDETILARVRQQFQAQINSTSNSHRMPCFAIGNDDDISWQPINNATNDMEFQYLCDMNARVILSAFQMSPDELPGYTYLSKGTNSQAISEASNEWMLEASRDLGIRPLLKHFEDFFNHALLPLFDEYLAKTCVLKFVGLSAETQEKEAQRLQQDSQIHMTYDEILEKVEKKALGKALGGEFPFNATYTSILDKYMTVGMILEKFFGVEGAAKDPKWAYVRDPFWFNMQQMQQQNQMQQQALEQGQAPQASGNAPKAGGEEDQQTPPQEQEDAPKGDNAAPEAPKGQQPEDLTRSIDQAIGLLSKSEASLPPSKRRILAKQKRLIDDFVKGWDQDLKVVQKDILEVADKLKPKS